MSTYLVTEGNFLDLDGFLIWKLGKSSSSPQPFASLLDSPNCQAMMIASWLK